MAYTSKSELSMRIQSAEYLTNEACLNTYVMNSIYNLIANVRKW